MNARLGIPRHLGGILADDLETMAAHADAEANPLYPVPVLWGRTALEHMYRVVAGGRFADEPAPENPHRNARELATPQGATA